MDIVLQRILSLIPRKENGDFLHGEKKKFANSLGYSDGQIVSMWEAGTSNSYMKKLHEIAAINNVSVEWLKGETDEKSPLAVADDGLSDIKRELMDAIRAGSEDQAKFVLEMIKRMK